MLRKNGGFYMQYGFSFSLEFVINIESPRSKHIKRITLITTNEKKEIFP